MYESLFWRNVVTVGRRSRSVVNSRELPQIVSHPMEAGPRFSLTIRIGKSERANRADLDFLRLHPSASTGRFRSNWQCLICDRPQRREGRESDESNYRPIYDLCDLVTRSRFAYTHYYLVNQNGVE